MRLDFSKEKRCFRLSRGKILNFDHNKNAISYNTFWAASSLPSLFHRWKVRVKAA